MVQGWDIRSTRHRNVVVLWRVLVTGSVEARGKVVDFLIFRPAQSPKDNYEDGM